MIIVLMSIGIGVAACVSVSVQRAGGGSAPLKHPPAAYITTLLTPKGGEIEIDR